MSKIKLFRGKGTAGADTVPDAFSFTDVTGQIESTPITSGGVTISALSNLYGASGFKTGWLIELTQ